jgi:spore germination protein GerM
VRRTSPGAIAACSLAAALLGACGIATTGPRAIPKSQLPNVPSGVTSTTAQSDFIPVTIVLLQASSNAPVAVNRFVPPKSDQLSTALSDLLLGPQGKDQEQGLFSAIPDTTRLRSVTPSNLAPDSIASTPVIVNLSEPFIESTGLAQVLEVQQVVATVSCFLSPSSPPRVLFRVEGLPLRVPISTGVSVSRPVTINDYGPVTCAAGT